MTYIVHFLNHYLTMVLQHGAVLVSDTKLHQLFITQIYAFKCFFGDKDTFMDKFKACCRTRSYNVSKVGREYCEKEPTKPLLKKSSDDWQNL